MLLRQQYVGKSMVFNSLTRFYVTVSNYLGMTVNASRGKAKAGSKEFGVGIPQGCTHPLEQKSILFAVGYCSCRKRVYTEQKLLQSQGLTLSENSNLEYWLLYHKEE